MATQWNRSSPVSVESMATQLKHCSKVQDLHQGKLIHAFITKSEEYAHNTFLINSVVHMYGSCHSFSEAKEAFSSIQNPNTHSWNIFINICVKSGKADEAFQAFSKMQQNRVQMNSYTCVCVMNACAKWVLLEMGRNVLSTVVMELSGCESELIVATAVVKMFGRCGALEDAKRVFDSMPEKDLITCSSIMGAYIHNNHGVKAMELYHHMKNSCFVPDQITCLCAIDACSCIRESKEGQRIHVVVLENGYSDDIIVSTSLVNMYGKCRDLEQARVVLSQIQDKNLITWNSAIVIFASNDQNDEAISFFHRMQLQGLCPDSSTYVAVLNACSSISFCEDGRRLHSTSMLLDGLDTDVVLLTAMIAMYGKCESLDEAKVLFGKIMHPDAISWCTIIMACMHNGQDQEALRYFQQMHCNLMGLEPDAAIFVSVLAACGRLSALDKGQNLHSAIVEKRHDRDITVATALINMYGKCGSLQDGERVFRSMEGCQNMVSWSAMIAAYAHNGHEREAVGLFREMQERCLVPNEVTFRSVLTACSYAGEITDGLSSFLSGGEVNGLAHTEEEHSLSMVDLLGRVGRLDEAEDAIHRVPKEKRVMAWACLLAACRMHGDVDRGARIATRLIELDPDNAASYVSLSNLYASPSGM